MSEACDIAIIGAGAAGLAAGIFAGEAARKGGRAARIVLLDGAQSVGAKILVSGGGRCNVTHDHIRPEDYSGSRNIVRNILAAFDERAAAKWFEEVGVRLKTEETGKVFPVSDSARTVLQALLGRLGEVRAELRTGCRVEHVAREGERFVVKHERGEILAGRVILATGGRSLPKTGSDGHGWEMARRLGHTVTRTYPALVPLVLGPSMFHARISGLSHEAELSTFADGKRVDRRAGSMLWTHFGMSGPVAMDASRFWVIARGEGKRAEMRCSFVPGRNVEEVERDLIDAAAARPRANVANCLPAPLPARLIEELLGYLGIDPRSAIGQLPRERRRELAAGLTGLPLPISGDRGWNYAEVTAGGVPLGEIDYRTMQSRVVPGLYLIGEILDCDGRIGGFNFQWAWATGHIAGRACVQDGGRT